jgi:hypothetical protein
MSAAPGTEIAIAAERLVPGANIEPIGGRSWLVSATTGDSQFSVRQLDPSLPATRIELIHEFLGRPELTNATALAGVDRATSNVFDARVWIDGAPLGTVISGEAWRSLHLPTEISIDKLGLTARSLGNFHRTGSTTSLLARAPHYRVKDALTGVRRGLELNERALAGEIRKESRARRWLTASRPLVTNAETNLEQAGYLRDEPAAIAHLDLWGSHIVLTGNTTITFLDCSMISAAPAVVDLAQLIVRTGPWSDERVEQMLTGYAESNSLPPLQRRMLPWFAALDAIASCGHLLMRAHDERKPLSDNDRRAALAGADQQLELLERLARAFVPPAPKQYRRPVRRRG